MAGITFGEFLSDQRMSLPLVVTIQTCSGATYIVTGADKGLGFEAAKHLVEVSSKIRNTQAGNAAMADIEAATHTKNVVEVWELDLSSYASVKAFANKAITELDRIDALIENAGIAGSDWILSEGHEACITVNVISTVLLAVLLLPKMSAVAKRFSFIPHISVVTSGAGFFTADSPEWRKVESDPFEKLKDEKLADMSKRYPLSKIIQVFAIRQLAILADYNRTGVVVNLVGPGFCKTELSVNSPFVLRMSIKLGNMLIGRTAEMGSRTLLHGAIAGKESHGRYLGNCEVREDSVPAWMTNADGRGSQKRVWEDLAKEMDSIEPDCVSKIS
ncbi:hypothetical protein HYALB_00006573 [Hymenoscyphus albidus]|uniref:Uncharacterized protein n=1 Tax=Hymenoscyphus albidus TaxID=595503 RepID=A0A9N9LZ15_9HELO|nr:hypothetical protein HYALB_00006573 [Hymenoscyphus albidus]